MWKIVILAAPENLSESGGDKNCLTTYVFNPVDSCTGTPSPEKTLAKNNEQKTLSQDDLKSPENLCEPNIILYERKCLGHSNFMAEYDINLKGCQHFGPDNYRKCCDVKPFKHDLSFGHFYSISRDLVEERTYDEPYAGDLPRRSWLCCPGSQRHNEIDQPPLLDIAKTPSTPGDPVTKAPCHSSCSGGCVCILNCIFY